MNVTRWIAVASLALGLHTQAQTPTPTQPQAQATPSAPPATSGPTMEQTIAFINEAFANQGAIADPKATFTDQRVTLIAPCVLRYHYLQVITNLGDDEESMDLPLKTLDPRTISISGNTSLFISVASPKVGFAKPFLGVFRSKETADRVMKAYIHAMAFCYDPQTASPF
jgi:hypothetical protein